MLKYEQLMNRLRARLGQSSEARLPPLATIAKEERMSLNTVQRAVQELKKEGVLVTRTGRGTFSRGSLSGSDALDSRNAEQTALPLRFIAFTSSIRHVFEDPIGDALIKGLEKIFAAEGLGRPVQFHSAQVHRRLQPLPPESLAQAVCGTICLAPFSAEYLTQLAAQVWPIVSVDRDATPWGIDSVAFDNVGAALLATTRLIESGHRRIACFAFSQTEVGEAGADPALADRFEGYRLAHLAGGLPLDERLAVPVAELTEEAVCEAAALLADRRERFSAVLVNDGRTAVSLMRVFEARGIRVPQDCSVVHAGETNPGLPIGGAFFEAEPLAEHTWELLAHARRSEPPFDLAARIRQVRKVALAPRFMPGQTLRPPRHEGP